MNRTLFLAVILLAGSISIPALASPPSTDWTKVITLPEPNGRERSIITYGQPDSDPTILLNTQPDDNSGPVQIESDFTMPAFTAGGSPGGKPQFAGGPIHPPGNPSPVPDATTTLGLLGLGVSCLASFKRKK